MPDAWAINSESGTPSYIAAELRRFLAALESPGSHAVATKFGAGQGPRVGSGTGLVALSGSTITVKAHAGVISPDLSSLQGAYLYQLSADETHTLTAAHASLSRDDLVVMRVDDDDEDASGSRQVLSVYVVGTPGSGVPALPARTFELARINVPPSGGGSAVVTERNRWSVAAGGILPVRDGTDRDSATDVVPYEGRAVARLDTDRLEVYDGAAWQRAAHWSPSGRTGCRLYKATSSIPDSDPTAISWGVEEQDSDGFISVPGTTITIPAGLGGLYSGTFNTKGLFSGTGRNFVRIALTSSLTDMPDDFRMPMEPAEDRGMVSFAGVPLAAGDTLVCEVYHSSGGPVDFESFLSLYRQSV